jgi:cell fate regulator YaaT (PSP1 superfamily)
MIVLARYGVIPDVVRCSAELPGELQRGESVVIRTHRGVELATVLQRLEPSPEPDAVESAPTSEVLRQASLDDLQRAEELSARAQTEFSQWEQRIREWGLDLQLIDLERLLDESKLVLYVLNARGPECTKLALQAAAAGLGLIEVQPVSAEGLVTLPSGGGCGSCGCN